MAGVDAADFRPNRAETDEVDAGKGQQLERRAAAAVLVDVEAVAGRLVGGQREAFKEAAAVRQGAALTGKCHLPRGTDAAELQPRRRQALVGVVGAQAQPVLGARGEHAVGLGDAARHQVVDHHADVALGAARR